MRNFEHILLEGIPKMEMRSFKLLLHQHWSNVSIAFHGNPTNGLQIMGLLETRMLDFKTLIVLGLNEGKLPNNNPIRTLIPMDLRTAFHLPATREKQGLFAHHFYRLLHQANRVIATYTASVEQIGSNEASRYLMQLELELTQQNKQVRLEKLLYHVPFPERPTLNTTRIEKSTDIIQRLKEFLDKPLSASALNKFMTCPLDYYYRYIVEFGEDKEVEEEIENHTFGTIIHGALEQLFKPFAQRDKQGAFILPAPPPVMEKDVLKMLGDFKGLIYQGFLKQFDNDEQLFKTGKNRLSYEMAIEITKNVLEEELRFVQSLSEPLYIEQIEAEMFTEIEVPLNGGTQLLKFKGSGLISSFNSCKHAFQLTLYCVLFKEKYGCLPDEAKINSLINIHEDFNLSFKDRKLEEMIPVLSELLNEILQSLFDIEQGFEHNPESNYCLYCT